MQALRRFKPNFILNSTKNVRYIAPLASKSFGIVSKKMLNMPNMSLIIGRSRAITMFSRCGFASLPSHKKLNMPSLSPTMEKGNIKKWVKKEGDEVHPGDVLCEVETDKATVDFEMQDDGFIAKILKPEGSDDVPLGELIAILVEDKNDIAAFKDYSGESGNAKEVPKEDTGTKGGKRISDDKREMTAGETDIKTKRTDTKFPPHKKLTMPSLSPTMEQGSIKTWKVKEGDEVHPGDALCDVETDKATVDFEVQDDGYLAKILKKDGTSGIAIGDLIAILVEDKKDLEAFKEFSAEDVLGTGTDAEKAPTKTEKKEDKKEGKKEVDTSKKNQEEEQAESRQEGRKSQPSKSEQGEHKFISPLARKTAGEKGLNYSQIEGTGPGGRIINADVLEFKEVPKDAKKSAESATQQLPKKKSDSLPASTDIDHEDIPVSNIRKITAERLSFSKQNIPHYYVTIECEVDKLLSLRAELNKISSSKISVNDLIIKAASLACVRVPEANSSWQGTFIRAFKDCDMSVAVQTDNGLITPIIKNANRKGLSEIANEMKSLVAKAKENKLKPHEFIGGTFTISNMGMFGVHSFSAIINPPQACILAVGSAEKRVVPNEGSADKPYKVVTKLNVTLSSDHRVVDGAIAARWTSAFRELIENPETMLL